MIQPINVPKPASKGEIIQTLRDAIRYASDFECESVEVKIRVRNGVYFTIVSDDRD